MPSVEVDVSLGDSDGVKDCGAKKRYTNNYFSSLFGVMKGTVPSLSKTCVHPSSERAI